MESRNTVVAPHYVQAMEISVGMYICSGEDSVYNGLS